MEKSSTTSAITAVGQKVPYTFAVTNSGAVDMYNIEVMDEQVFPALDSNLSAIECPQTTLAPDAAMDCTAEYTVTQADLDHGSVADVATVAGENPSGYSMTSVPSALEIKVGEPGLSVVTSSTTATFSAVGQKVPYKFSVTNTGGTLMSGIVVTGQQLAPALDKDRTPVVCPQTSLLPAGTMDCAAEYTVSQADLDHGSITGGAGVAGTSPSGVRVTSPLVVLRIDKAAVSAEPGLSVERGTFTTAITAVGQKVDYWYSVKNTGGTQLNTVELTDKQFTPSLDANRSPMRCPLTSLEPGKSMGCIADYWVTQADLDHGSVSATATATAISAGVGRVSSNPIGLTIGTSQLTVVKSSTTRWLTDVGQKVPYTFAVTNSGLTLIDSIVVTDTQTAPALDEDLTAVVCPQTALAPAATMDCTATYTVSQADLDNGQVHDTATATGSDPSGGPVNSRPSELWIENAPDPDLTVVKSSTTTVITQVGQKVPYKFAVTNVGDFVLDTITVTDTQTAPALNSNLSEVVCPQTSLDPGDAIECTATYTVSQADFDHGSITDEATVKGEAYSEEPVSGPGSKLTITTSGSDPALSVVKSSTTTEIATVGQKVPYTFAVTNTGGVTVKDVTVVDKQTAPALDADLSAISCPQATLVPGGSMECTAEYTVSDADLKSGAVTDVATATGKTVSDEPVESAPSKKTIKKRGSIGTGSLGSLGLGSLGSLGLGALGLGSLGLGAWGLGSLGTGSLGSSGPANPGTPGQPGNNPGNNSGQQGNNSGNADQPGNTGQAAGPKGERPTAIDGGGAGLGVNSTVGFGLAAVLLALGAAGAVVAIRRTR